MQRAARGSDEANPRRGRDVPLGQRRDSEFAWIDDAGGLYLQYCTVAYSAVQYSGADSRSGSEEVPRGVGLQHEKGQLLPVRCSGCSAGLSVYWKERAP